MFRTMVGRTFGRQFAALIVALGVMLSGSAPAWAVPAVTGMNTMPGMSMALPGTTMQNACMATPDKGSPAKQAPCKNSDSSCATCAGCAINVGLPQAFSSVGLLYRDIDGVFASDVNPDGIALLPALPPPIVRA